MIVSPFSLHISYTDFFVLHYVIHKFNNAIGYFRCFLVSHLSLFNIHDIVA